MATINELLNTRRTTDEALLRDEQVFTLRSFEYLAGLIRSMLVAEIALVPDTGVRWDQKFTDGVVPSYEVTLTLSRNVYGQTLPLVVRAFGVRFSETVTAPITLIQTTTLRLEVTKIGIWSRRFPPVEIVVNGHVIVADMVSYTQEETPDLNLRQNLVTPPTPDPLTPLITPPWPQVNLAALMAAITVQSAAVLYAERFPEAV